MFERTQDGLGPKATVDSIHGSLLAVGELLRLVFRGPDLMIISPPIGCHSGSSDLLNDCEVLEVNLPCVTDFGIGIG